MSMKRRKRSWRKRVHALFFAKKRSSRFSFAFKKFFAKKLRFGHYLTTAIVAITIAASVFTLFSPKMVLGQTYAFSQIDWSGGAAGDTVSAPSNLSSWNKYASASGVTAGASAVSLAPSQGTPLESFTTTTNRDTANTSANWNTSNGRLEIPDQNSYLTTDYFTDLNGFMNYLVAVIFNPNEGLYYGGGYSGSFAEYDPTTHTVTDRRTSSGLESFWHGNSINKMALDAAHNKIYMIGGGGQFAVYDTQTKIATDLRSSSGLSVFWTTTYGVSLSLDSSTSKLYLGCNTNKFAVYDTGTGLATDLSGATGFSALWSNEYLYSIVISPSTHLVYMIGGQDRYNSRFSVYDPATGVVTDLYDSSGLSGYMTKGIHDAVWNPTNSLIYMAGGDNSSTVSKFAVFNPVSGAATNLYVSSGVSSIVNYDKIASLAIDSNTGKVYLGSVGAGFTVYTPGTPGTSVSLKATSGLSAFWQTSGVLDNGFVNILAADAAGGKIFVANSYQMAIYTIGSPGTATDISSEILPNAMYFQNMTFAIADPHSNLVYIGGSYNRFGAFNRVNRTFTNLSSALTSYFSGGQIAAAVIDSAGTKIYLFSGNKFASYDIGSGEITDLYTSSHMNDWGDFVPECSAYDAANEKIYVGGWNGVFGVYDIGSNTSTNLTISSGLSSFWSTARIYSLAYEASGGKVYLGGESTNFASYSAAEGAIDLHTTSGLSGFWGSSQVEAMTVDTVNHHVYLGGSGRFARYTPGSPGSAVNRYLNPGLANPGVSTNALAFDPQNNIIYIAGYGRNIGIYRTSSGQGTSMENFLTDNYWNRNLSTDLAIDSTGVAFMVGAYGKFSDIVAPCSACVAASVALDTTTQNIVSATLTKNDTLGTGTITYQLSNDGGATYNTVTAGSLYTFPTIGSDLRFKITITGNATVQDLSIAYNYYATSGTLTSSKFDSTDAANIVNRLSWDEDTSLPAGTTVTVSLRTADTSTNLTGAWSDLTNASANCSKVGTTVTCGASALPSGMQDGSGDRWFQYKIAIASDGRNTATVSSVGIQFVVNAAPEVRNVTASQNSDGTVTIHYEVRDTDTATGSPANRGHVTPSFEYWDGSSYQTISALASGDTEAKTVAMDGTWNDAIYAATWTPATDYSGHYMNNTAKIRVVANDNEGANPTGSAESATYTLDTLAPSSGSITVDATTTPATIHLTSTDDNAVTMKVSSSDPTLATTASEPFAATKTMTLSEGATVYAKFTDAYQNSTSVLSATVPATPTAIMIQDTSNILSDPRLYRLFVAWKVVAGPFASYRVHRSTALDNPADWPEVATIGTRAINYYLDVDVVQNGHYYYYVDTVDANGNLSFRSTIVDGIADGAQTGGEGGGGIGPAPVISNVSAGTPQATVATVTWNTDTLSDSTVSYSISPSTFTTDVYIGSLVNNDSGVGRHEVVLTNLLPLTTYYYRVASKDINDQTTVDDHGGPGYSFTTPGGPVISNTSVEQTTNTTARISWTTNVPATTELVHSTHADMSQPTYTTGTSDPTTGHVVNLTNLNPGSMYFFYARSVDAGLSETTDKHVVNGVPQYYSFTTTNDFTPPIFSGISVRTQPTSVDIIWTTDKIADSQVEYGLTTAYGTSTLLDSTPTTRHVITILGLAPQTAYNFRVRSRGNNAVLGTSANQTFTTSQAGDATPPAISDVVVSSLSLNSASINWVTDEPATSFVDYGTTVDLGSSSGSSVSASAHSVTLDGLAGGAQYYFRVRSADAAGNSSVDNNDGDFYTFVTAADGGAPTISNPDDIISMNAFRVVWSTNELADSQLEYGPDAGYGETTVLDETLVMSHSVAVSSLSAATAYHYRILTRDASGNLTTGPDRVVTTAAQADHTPPLITSPIASNIGRTTATITWTTDEKSTSAVLYGPNTFYAYNASQMNDNTTAHTVELTGLIPGIKYYYKVESDDAAGNISTDDDHGAGLTFTTVVDSAPPVISGVSTALVSDVSAVVVWTTDEPASAQVIYGTTAAYGLQTAVTTTLSTVHSITLLGLSAQTNYFYKVVSVDAYANAATDDNVVAGHTGYTFSTTDVPGRVVRALTPTADIIPPNIYNLKVGSIKQTSALVSWTTDENAYSIVKFGPDANYGSMLGSLEEGVMAHEVALAGLTAGAVYHFMVVSADVSGNKAFSDDQIFATLNADGTSPVIPVPETVPSGNTNTSPPENPPVVNEQTAKLQIMGVLSGLLKEPALGLVPEDFFTTTMNEIIDRVVHAPSIVGISPKVEVTGTTAKVSWTTDKKANGTVGFVADKDYRATAADPYILSASDPDINSSVHEVNISDLSPATTYHYQVRSKGLIGPEARSKDATFVTASELPVISDLALGDMTNYSVSLKWTTNIPTSTSVSYKNTATGSELTQGDTAFLRDHAFKLENLEAGIDYLIVVSAQDQLGHTALSAPISLTTSKDTTPPVISKTSSESTLYPGKDSKVQTIINWDTDEPATTIVHYQRGLAKDAPVTDVLSSDTMPVTRHTVVITKFLPATVYKFWVESTDRSGNTAKSNDFLILTPEQKATVIDVIISNFEQVFGWTKKVGR